MTPDLLSKLEASERRLADLESEMATGAAGDWQVLAREHGRLLPLVRAFRQWRRARAALDDLRGLADDDEVRELAEADIATEMAALGCAHRQVLELLSPEAEENARNCFIEIRAAVGGNESCLFAADLQRMYGRAAEEHGWAAEVVSHSAGEVGGFKEVVLRVTGEGAYGRLKFESGAHRVQRVPETESQGRVHTSVVTVAVLAEAGEEDDLVIAPADLRVETFRASGAGGQHVNTTDSAVRMTHLPTGVIAECQDERSQHKNRERALSVLRARIVDRQRRERLEKEASERRSLVGSGDRSDRIRTYNFPQGRMTDHRIGLTLYKLGALMEGHLGEVFDALAKADEEQRALGDSGA